MAGNGSIVELMCVSLAVISHIPGVEFAFALGWPPTCLHACMHGNMHGRYYLKQDRLQIVVPYAKCNFKQRKAIRGFIPESTPPLSLFHERFWIDRDPTWSQT